MQLSKIKMSGFKSFVDPTVVNLPSKLVAVVGPNGCGKSNIIDAVTWVMGESSPKYLRGEALTDVIFNGSTGRKPVGQASVEMIFDNSDGTIGGEYAKYAEISVKRVINRESESTYYLNGVRCRKRDVADIFYGTGLGPRSYSIIGQNMITKVIEAKPAELRGYLEEAAGISKYKERRHETELRIGHTKENLARVSDLQAELEKQLDKLKHQANVAEKYKVLKEQERTLRAEWLSVQWRAIDNRMIEATLDVQREETALEARQSELISTDREIEQLRHEQRVAQDAFQEVQRRYYAIGNEITRSEQDILHHQERQQQWENDLKQAQEDWQLVTDQIAEAEDNLQELEQEAEDLEPRLSETKEEVEALEEDLAAAEEATQQWQHDWDEFNETSAKTTQTAQVEKTRIQHLEQQITTLQRRQEQLLQDQGRYDATQLTSELEVLAQQSTSATEQLEAYSQQLVELKENINLTRTEQQQANAQLDQVRSELQRLRGQQASLEALQQTALGQRDNPASPWLAKLNLESNPRLAQQIEVETGWELAVEKVLGFCLQGICLDQATDVIPHLNEFTAGNLCLFTTQETPVSKLTHSKGTLLAQKISAPWSLDSLVAGIYVADTLDDALTLCAHLDPHESVVTRDGVWLNRSWLKILRQEDPAAGIFQREQELKQLADRIEILQTTQQTVEQTITECRDQLQTLEMQRDQLQQTYNQQQAQVAQVNTQRKMKQERLSEVTAQSERIQRELLEAADQMERAQAELVKARDIWQQALSELETFAQTRDRLLAERDRVRQTFQSLRESTNASKNMMHELEIRLQTAKSQKASLQTSVSRLQTQLSALSERKTVLQGELASMQPIDVLKQTLSRALDRHVSVEVELNTARVAMEALDQEFQRLEEKRQTIEHEINKVRSKLESLRVDSQGLKVKAEGVLEQLKDTEFKLEDMLRTLPQEATAEEWQIKLEQTTQRINRLGAINLVAIDEYATCLERKQYLDKQTEDLQAGLATLEDAIAKIDKETRTRFKETFDKVNQRFQELFPTIFGGGKATLELDNEDLLEAGVTMMACPPGKRNSSIYLLSGGEKSLTALALIFSIFYLNPAPFCLLDEVDAALDDANVLRYTRLVKAMSENTQFIFISHNKIAIEMGEHLIGVTMNEPGVSRLVSVDIDKAMTMVEQ